jgi:acetyl-CoA acetyltransferase
VIGSAIESSISRQDRSLEEILYEVSQRALADAGIESADIEGIIVAANDQYDGRAISIMAASGSVGGVDHDILSTPSASEHAFVLGALRIASGQFQTQLIVAWSPTEATSLPEVQRLAADPYYHRRLPLDELASHALQASALENTFPEARELAMSILAKNRRHGAKAYPSVSAPLFDEAAAKNCRPTYWPLTSAMVAQPVTGAVALVLASGEFASARKLIPTWVRGMGWATEPSFLGDRDLSVLPSLEAARKQAYAESGIENPMRTIDVAEIADATPYQELMGYEALGFCLRREWTSKIAVGTFAAGGELPVNLSGGALSINPVFCTGLIRIAEIANQVRGKAGRHQHPNVEWGLAHAASGFAMQYNTVIVMSRHAAGGAA